MAIAVAAPGAGRGLHPRAVGVYPGFGEALLMVAAVLALQLAAGLGLAVMAMATGLGLVAGGAGVAALANLLAFGAILAWGTLRAPSRQRPVFPFAGTRPAELAMAIAGAAGLAVLASELDNVTRWLFPMPRVLAELMAGLLGGGLASLLLLVVVAPVTEELLFRGLILRWFLGRYRKWTAIGLSAALFGLVHVNLYQLASGLLLGLYLGWLFAGTGALVAPLAGHAMVNLLALGAASWLLPEIQGFTLEPGALVAGIVEFQPWWLDAAAAGLTLAAVASLRCRFARHVEARRAIVEGT